MSRFFNPKRGKRRKQAKWDNANEGLQRGFKRLFLSQLEADMRKQPDDVMLTKLYEELGLGK